MSVISTSLASALVVLLCIGGFSDAERSERGLPSLPVAITTYTGRNPFDYNNYGCYCGLGGGGKIMDSVDRCCYDHDRCYASVNKDCIIPAQLILNRINCSNGSCSCPNTAGSCAHKTCTCDVQFGVCLKGKPYNRNNKGNCQKS
ncbi:acidic phospholipase A2 E [Biomphalaria glabrata]|uniref:Phospholipase A2 n=1 Tax=Biomphalaria glabrata TaxID=6526 RepID=A0A9U8DUW0_BIOGL|nr:acidic phospholipase A2 E-like [Biomphalaria glabrata]KAI8737029.1 acidic phospholipase A2 E-like [Biomphalaria glabrata]KAI8777075.1 acidic phospholipase A2 E [Biomphalaria glabrata]